MSHYTQSKKVEILKKGQKKCIKIDVLGVGAKDNRQHDRGSQL